MRFNLRFLGTILFALVFLVGGFFVKNAVLANGALIFSHVPSENLTTGVQANFVLQAPDTTGHTISLSDNDAGGTFYNGAITGNTCNHTSPLTNKTISINSNKAFCYSNSTPGTYTITASTENIDSVSTIVIINTQEETLPTMEGSVTIDGTPKFGEILTANISQLINAGTPTYQWKRIYMFDNSMVEENIPLATNGTYLLTETDIGKNIKVTATAKPNIGTGSISSDATENIDKLDKPDAPPLPFLAGKTSISVTLVANDLYEFSKDDEGTWQDSPEFTGLTADTYYAFKSRIKETSTTNAGAENKGRIIKTYKDSYKDAQTVPNNEGRATLTNETKELVITDPDQAVIVDAEAVTDGALDISSFTPNESGERIVPAITINSSNAKVIIQPSTKITATGWNGTMMLPRPDTSITNIAPVGFSVGNFKIEMGSPDVTLTFDKAVKITLSGVTGDVGYRSAGSNDWQMITTKCNNADDASNITSGECYFQDGVDTVIWTYHFTTFGELKAVNTQSSSGGSIILAMNNVASEKIIANGCNSNANDLYNIYTGEPCEGKIILAKEIKQIKTINQIDNKNIENGGIANDGKVAGAATTNNTSENTLTASLGNLNNIIKDSISIWIILLIIIFISAGGYTTYKILKKRIK
ncbi:hypothetical protein HXX01_04300 [Candidatus Nomurabacteria bacterium]|nr:hypothetical protein [Candidatus Nomurabacteria bacterium]